MTDKNVKVDTGMCALMFGGEEQNKTVPHNECPVAVESGREKCTKRQKRSNRTIKVVTDAQQKRKTPRTQLKAFSLSWLCSAQQ